MFVLVLIGCAIAIYGSVQLIRHGRDPHKQALKDLARQEHARARMENWYN